MLAEFALQCYWSAGPRLQAWAAGDEGRTGRPLCSQVATSCNPQSISTLYTNTHNLNLNHILGPHTNYILSPIAMRFALQPLCRHPSSRVLALRSFSTAPLRLSSAFDRGPAPHRLPKEEQEMFERLQRQSVGAFSTPRDEPTSSSASSSTSSVTTSSPSDARIGTPQSTQNKERAKFGENDIHPHLRRGAPPEFEGDVNPKTGEVGGPKNEPLRWGGGGDWSFNGRVTDF